MAIEWYPWLNRYYRKIINRYYRNNLHHSILINSPFGMGIASLIWAVGRKFFCKNDLPFKSCNKCTDCVLMNVNNHPDLHIIKVHKITEKINIDHVKFIINKVCLTSNRGNIKLVWIVNINNLTQSAVSCLLKIIEEPPKNTFFFIRTNTLHNIHLNFISRCMLWNIYPPNKKISLYWLIKKTGISKKICNISLKICNNVPIVSEKMLNVDIWNLRIFFLKVYIRL